MPSFSKPTKLFKGPFSFAVPKVPSITSSGRNNQTTQSSPPNVHNFSPSPEELMKMNSLENTNIITITALEEIQRKLTKILNFPTNEVELRGNPDDDVSTLSGGSRCAISRRSKRTRSRNLRHKKSRQMRKSSSMNTADEVSEKNAGNIPSQIESSETPFIPTEVLEEIPSKQDHVLNSVVTVANNAELEKHLEDDVPNILVSPVRPASSRASKRSRRRN